MIDKEIINTKASTNTMEFISPIETLFTSLFPILATEIIPKGLIVLFI